MRHPISAALKEEVLSILREGTPQYLSVTCTISSPNGAVNIQLDKIERLRISQRFLTSYSDFIFIEFELSPSEYLSCFRNYADLVCVVEIYLTERNSEEAIEPLVTLQKKILFRDKKDPFKEQGRDELLPDEDTVYNESHQSNDIWVQADLMSPELYYLRKKQIHFNLRDCTMKDMLYFLVHLMGIEKASIVDPDNDVPVTNFVIPPMKNISNVFGFLQNEYVGVYAAGLSNYYINGTMYIYPAWEPVIDDPDNIVDIYSVPDGSFMGDTYHVLDGDRVRIISNTKSASVDNIEQGMENVGSSFMIQEGANIKDKWRVMQGETVTIPETNMIARSLDTDKGMTSGTWHPRFKFSCNNQYALLSELAAINVTNIVTGWKNAVPYTFTPRTKINYHFDGEDGYETCTGAPTVIEYDFVPTNRLTIQKYSCSCSISFITT